VQVKNFQLRHSLWSSRCTQSNRPLFNTSASKRLFFSNLSQPRRANQIKPKPQQEVEEIDEEGDEVEDDPKKREQDQKEAAKVEKELAELEKSGKVLPAPKRCRAIFDSRKSGTFTTVSLESDNDTATVCNYMLYGLLTLTTFCKTTPSAVPLYGSQMPYIWSKSRPGQPIMAIRRDERHYDNLQRSKRSSMAVRSLPLLCQSENRLCRLSGIPIDSKGHSTKGSAITTREFTWNFKRNRRSR